MHRFVIFLAVLLVAAPIISFALDEAESGATESIRPPSALLDPSEAPPPAASAGAPAVTFTMPGEDTIFREAAAVAWEYVSREYHPATGLTNSVAQYPYATIWDVGSMLAAYYCAHQLGLITDAEFDERMGRALDSLQRLALFAGVAFNKNYQVARGAAAGRNDRETAEGYGWSATDLGRLLVWLRVVATAHPQHATAAAGIVDRLNLQEVVADGYLWGESLDGTGRRRRYQEGRLGYEQYAASGFALWGAYADRALSSRENAREVEVYGVPILVDSREGGHLTSEPFILLGMEVGWWSPHWRELATRVLTAQRTRFERTGQITIVGEDAIPVAPYYFYYYTLHDAGQDFAVVSLNASQPLAGPRWVSTKGAFGWYAIDPGPYTWQALQAVLPAAGASGWSSGIYEQSGRPTEGQNINTSAVILEAALYHELGQPILAAAQVGTPGR